MGKGGGRKTRKEKEKKKREKEEMKSETAVPGERRGWKTGDSGREWTARAISGGD